MNTEFNNNFILELISHAIELVSRCKTQKQLDLILPLLPYKLEKLANNRFMILNKEYKPLGMRLRPLKNKIAINNPESGWINYEDFGFLSLDPSYVKYDSNTNLIDKNYFFQGTLNLKDQQIYLYRLDFTFSSEYRDY